MPKAKQTEPFWRRHLRELMEQKGFNPRSLSLAAGLNATAVRDMLEGRTQSPRYDTARALANALETTPAILMGDDDVAAEVARKGRKFGENLELFTEIISRLVEVIENDKLRVPPRKFAALTATLYRRVQNSDTPKKELGTIRAQIHDFLDYDNLRDRKRRRYG
jgi:transcriptional regulator with XRE-family HTH domain